MRALMPYYDAERARMGQAAQGLPMMQQLQNQQQLQGGQLQEGYAQQPIDEAMARFEHEQQLPYTRLGAYANLMGPMTGVPYQTQPAEGSDLSGALGTAMAGAELGSTWGPWGTAIGGLLGGLGGLL